MLPSSRSNVRHNGRGLDQQTRSEGPRGEGFRGDIRRVAKDEPPKIRIAEAGLAGFGEQESHGLGLPESVRNKGSTLSQLPIAPHSPLSPGQCDTGVCGESGE